MCLTTVSFLKTLNKLSIGLDLLQLTAVPTALVNSGSWKILGFSQTTVSNSIRNNGLTYLYQEKLDNGIKATGKNGRVVNLIKGLNAS